ncbi:hypothetical protein A1O3_06314 [Capronia epimyces CBS 606.96]|uniref:Uncharacterized protein n=1 Tax=Capronia epimyces CBS 606.96 TaxID=1182542 RepID=W9XZV2_9EURO|nr:uncharacterized protein A1O3_06314 [Capronia epimyces CBS 606.96]EXJ82501.1 hypothetical protein A1O3_06314 [Capronia epimyces CBS 606.96]
MATEIALGPQADFNIIATEILAELRAMREQSTRDTRAIRQDIANVRQELVTIITASLIETGTTLKEVKEVKEAKEVLRKAELVWKTSEGPAGDLQDVFTRQR